MVQIPTKNALQYVQELLGTTIFASYILGTVSPGRLYLHFTYSCDCFAGFIQNSPPESAGCSESFWHAKSYKGKSKVAKGKCRRSQHLRRCLEEVHCSHT
eukprot:1145823-Pelagomonas_calceolata.AAC.12